MDRSRNLLCLASFLSLLVVPLAQGQGRLFYTDTIGSTPGVGSSNHNGLDSLTVVPKGLGGFAYQGMDVDPVECQIYYAYQGTIERVNYNGTDRRTILSNPPFAFSPQSVSLDLAGGRIYWYSNNSARFGYCDMDGSNAQVVVSTGDMTPAIAPRSIHVDSVAGRIYWYDIWYQGWRCGNRDGSGLQNLFTTPTQAQATALDRSGGMLYWIEGDNIYRRPSDGSGTSQLFFASPVPLRDRALAVSAYLDRVYFATGADLAFTSLTNPGTLVTQQVAGQSQLASIAVHEGSEVQVRLDAPSYLPHDPFTLSVRGAQPSRRGFFVVTGVNGVLTWAILMGHPLDAEGRWDQPGVVPGGLSAVSIDVSDVTFTLSGRVLVTDPATLVVP